MVKKSFTVSRVVDDKYDKPVDLDHALAIAGVGWYNLKYCLVLTLFLISAIVDAIGYSFLLPAAKCDLQMTEAQRGVIGSIPYIGTVLTSYPWGYLVDTKGRKKVVIISSVAASIFGILASFMPDLISFTIFKFLSGLCIGCPSAAPYSYIGELMPPRHRDLTLSITNAMQLLGSALIPLVAWAILPLDFKVNFGLYYFRPWRLLNLLYSCFFLLSAMFMCFGPESPKYLISQGKHDESLKVLQMMYSGNKGKPINEYPVKRLIIPEEREETKSFFQSLIVQTVPLLKPPYLKWLATNGIILFGIFANLNGLILWLPDFLNRIFISTSRGLAACDIIRTGLNETVVEDLECDDSIDTKTFIINTVASCGCALVVLAISTTVKIVGKKTILVLIQIIIGILTLIINFINNEILYIVALSTIPMLALAVGPIHAFAVDIFPTHLRGMAISLSMMFGKCGSIVGGNIAGALIDWFCELTFYLFGGVLILCGLIALSYPRSSKPGKTKKNMTHL